MNAFLVFDAAVIIHHPMAAPTKAEIIFIFTTHSRYVQLLHQQAKFEFDILDEGD